MIYAYIFVMAGVTYLIRMLPLTLVQKKDYEYLCTFVFILHSLCMFDSNDISGYSLCCQFTNRCILRFYSSGIYGIEKEKFNCGGFVCLYSCVYRRENFRNDLKNLIKSKMKLTFYDCFIIKRQFIKFIYSFFELVF